MVHSKNLSLSQRLADYADSQDYPFHMPGHKRRAEIVDGKISRMDITEIPGFDDFHDATGILKDAMDDAAAFYGSSRTWYSVNGSTACVLAAVCAAVGEGGTLLRAVNRHWSVDNAVELMHIHCLDLYPRYMEELAMDAGIVPEDVEQMLIQNPKISAVLIVSPTYEGIVSDVEAIARICHERKAVLIVDAAHGAHFSYADWFPKPPQALGADLVIESLHKTLPALTQTALLHLVSRNRELENRISHYMDIFITSSPSYILIASIDECIRRMRSEQMQEQIRQYRKNLMETRKRLAGMKNLHLLNERKNREMGIFDLDETRITISLGERKHRNNTYVHSCTRKIVSGERVGMNGYQLSEYLQKKYHLVMEKSTEDYIIAISTVCDSNEGLQRLAEALLEIDQELESTNSTMEKRKQMGKIFYLMGKSASGKDSLYKELLKQFPELKTVVLYTTRPKRDQETEGVEYHFIDQAKLDVLKKEGRCIECRTYQTVLGPWSYATVQDGQFCLNQSSFLMIGTLESYQKMQECFGAETLVPLYIEVPDDIRLQRAMDRESMQKNPRFEELKRRFEADAIDFSEENLEQAGIQKRYQNLEFEACLKQLCRKIREQIGVGE